MPQTLVTLLTAGTLLAHAVIGCCWHCPGKHRHHEWQVCGLVDDADHETGDVATCEHDHDSSPAGFESVEFAPAESPSPSHSPWEAPECDHPECTFLAARGLSLNLDLPLVGMLTLPVEAAAAAAAESLRRDDAWASRADVGGPPRARLQVWLL